MDINKALEHFEWKFKNTWKPTKKDIEAYNSIVHFKKMSDEKALTDNESLAKLWIESFILKSNSYLYNAETSIRAIDETLNKSVYDWCLTLKEQIPMMRFNIIGNNKYPIHEINLNNFTEVLERNNKIVSEFENELTEALKHNPKEEDVIKFVANQINRIIKK